jgi:hypothetical protein
VTDGIVLYWLPLGAGGRSVRTNGRVFEAVMAALQRRNRCDLYHSALEVHVAEGRFTIEMTPVPDDGGFARGVVAEGAVGSRLAGRLRIFRYENRRWLGGVIPDLDEAVASPIVLTCGAATARRVLDLVPLAPTPVWGRDEFCTGEMWNSNSLVAWLLHSAGIDMTEARLPERGRAPGWDAGIAVASGASPAHHRRRENRARVAARAIRWS